uniref:ATP synthase protein MI25 n=1 Tax=Solanum tuberosum TaxID=4113 RepID=M1CIM1_SOLTU
MNWLIRKRPCSLEDLSRVCDLVAKKTSYEGLGRVGSGWVGSGRVGSLCCCCIVGNCCGELSFWICMLLLMYGSVLGWEFEKLRMEWAFENCFIIFSRKSLGNTFKVTLDGRIQAIQEESQQFPNPNEVVPPESNEQQRLLRISLRICGTVVESLPMARCAPKCEKTVQALLCRNLNVKSATLPNATSSRRIRLQDDIAIKMHVLVGKRFYPRCSSKAERVEFIRESLVVLRMVRVGDSLKNKEFE